MIIHKIIVAHGAVDACKNFSGENISGSLAVSYSDLDTHAPPQFPLMIQLDKNNPVHILDSHSLPIILGELDTVKDLSDYLDAKLEAISKLDLLVYCGEEDLLAHYWRNKDVRTGRHFIGVSGEKSAGLLVTEGHWDELVQLSEYKSTKRANEISYYWDDLINRTCDHWLNGRLLGDADLLSRPNAILEMAKEPRFMRRAYAEHIRDAIQQFPAQDRFMRHMRFFTSYYEKTAYLFLQLWVPMEMRGPDEEYRAKRKQILRTACGAAKNRFPPLETIVGIAIEPPKLSEHTGEDFVWLDCRDWSEKQKCEIEDRNKQFGFFDTGHAHNARYTEFVSSPIQTLSIRFKAKRNELCPCGSGKKFKSCHGVAA